MMDQFKREDNQEEAFDEALKQLAREEPLPIPEDYHGRVFHTLANLKEEKKKRRPYLGYIAAVLAVFIALPNLSPKAAAAMGEIPGLGALVEILTFREYRYDDGHSSAELKVPELSGSEAAAEVNVDIESYTAALLEQFEEERRETGEGFLNLSLSHSVVQDTADWFTLRVDVTETRGSGYNHSRFYNIDKASGRVVELADLFREDGDWQAALEGELLRQMEERKEEGFFPEEFTGLGEKQNFYWNESGELVLVFDEYTVAAGYVGMPEFVIEKAVYQDFLKET